MKRAVLYARYSSSLQEATSIVDQIAKCQRYCEQQGYEPVEIFSDSEMTGRNMRRPGLIALKEALGQRNIDIIIVEAVDRLGRRVADSLNLFDLANFSGVELYSLDEGPQDFTNMMLRGYAAQQFSEMIGHHTRRGMQGAITRGRLHTSAYGYAKLETEEGLNRKIHPEEATVVRRIFHETAEGRSADAIAKGLNKDRIPAPRGGTWDGSTIRGNKARQEGILNNRLYIGEASVCKFGRKYHPDTGKKAVFSTASDAEVKVFEELRIIEQSLWDKVQEEMARRGQQAQTTGNPHRARRQKHLLSGLMKCGCCGQTYVKVGNRRFGCREARKGACDNRVTIAQTRIETRVFRGLRELLCSEDLIRAFENAFKAEMRQLEGEDTAGGMKDIQRKIAHVRKAQGAIMNAIEAGADFADYSTRHKELKEQEEALEAQLTALESRQEAKSRPAPDIAAIFAQAIDQLEALLGSPDTVAQAGAYPSTLLGCVTLTPDPGAKDGLAVEVETDLKALRNGACLLG